VNWENICIYNKYLNFLQIMSYRTPNNNNNYNIIPSQPNGRHKQQTIQKHNVTYTTQSFAQNAYKERRPPIKQPDIYSTINPIATQNAARSNNVTYTTQSFAQNAYKGRRPPMKPPQEVIYGKINPIATQNAARTTKKTGYNNAEPTHQSLGDLNMKPQTVMPNVSTAANIAKKKQNTNLRKNGTPPVPPPRTRINNSSKQNKKPKGFFSKLFSKKAKQPKKTY
jgi:hypothetical protein